MSALNVVRAALAVICCLAPASSDVSVRTKYYTYTSDLILGREFFRGRSMLFTLCDRGPNSSAVLCRMKIARDVFDRTLPERYCNVTVRSRSPDPAELVVTEANLWDEDRAILAWRDNPTSSSRAETIVLRTVDFRSCDWTDNVVPATKEIGKLNRIFITTYANDYELAYANKNACGNYYCRVIVNGRGAITDPVPWFPYADSIFRLEPVESESSGAKLVVSVMDFGVNAVKFSWWRKTRMKELLKYSRFRGIGWATSNGRISICDSEKCRQFNQQGKATEVIPLNPMRQVREYLHAYNLPNGDILAVVCEDWAFVDTQHDYFRITMIGRAGRQQRSLDITVLNCSDKPNFAYMKFSQHGTTNACLTIFHFIDTPPPERTSKFTEICFSLNDFLS